MAGISTLHNRRLQDIAILMYKVKNNMCPTYISTVFEQPAIKYELRNHDFTIPRFNTVSFGKHSLRYMGPRVCSSVPRAQNNGRSTDNVRPDRGLDRSNSRLAGHFDRSFLDACRLMRFAL